MATNSFRDWRELGYERLLPIMPPDAKPLHHGEPGKTPGTHVEGDAWQGLAGWSSYCAAELELARWDKMGANVGLLATKDAFALDVDAHDPVVANQIETCALLILGPAPKRVGRAPKFALLYRTNEALEPRVLRFASTPERIAENRPDRVEIPTQLVIDGMHPGTRRPYSWPRPAICASDLTCVTAAQLAGFYDVLRNVLPITASLTAGVDRAELDQDALRGDLATIAKVVKAIPNDESIRYEEWVRIAAAIRGATQEDPELGLALFREFSDRAEHLPHRTEDPERVYWSVQPPFGVGAAYLLQEATKSPTFTTESWFEELPAVDSPALSRPSEAHFEVLRISDLINAPPPRFLLQNHIPENSLGFLYGNPGTGKSFIALDWALHLSYALPDWHGYKLHHPGAVAYIASEGVAGVGHRISAWLQAHGVSAESVAEERFGLLQRAVNFMAPGDIGKLALTLRATMAKELSLIVVDTVSRALPGADENLQKEMTLFVAACDALRQSFNCAVLGVHHANRQGNMRGSTVLEGAGDWVFKLQRDVEADTGTLWCGKQKDGHSNWGADYVFVSAIVNEAASSIVVRAAARNVVSSRES